MADNQSKMPEVGPIGRNLAAAVERLREARGLSYRKLSEKLDEVGRPIFPLGLSRLARAQRRVDVDDLVALAIVLGVNPSALLLPTDADGQDLVDLAPEVSQRAWTAWEWADGRMPLPEGPPPFPFVDVPDAAMADFSQHARPSLAVRGRQPAVRSAEILLTRILRATREMDESNADWWFAYIGRAIAGLKVSLDDWFASPPPAPGGEDQ